MSGPKCHLIIKGMQFCNSTVRGPGRMAVHSVAEFRSYEAENKVEMCDKCRNNLNKLKR